MAEVANGANGGEAAKPAGDHGAFENKLNEQDQILAEEIADPDDYDENGNLDQLVQRIKSTKSFKLN